MVDEPAGPLELLHRPPAGHRLDLGASCRARRAREQSPGSPASAASRSVAADRPDVDLERAALGDDVGRVPPAMTPTLTVTPGQRPFSAWSRGDEVGRREDRVAALLGLDAGVGRPAVDGDPSVEDALARRDDVAVGAGALEDEAGVGVRGELPDVRRRGRRADLLVGVGDERQPLERQRARAEPTTRGAA